MDQSIFKLTTSQTSNFRTPQSRAKRIVSKSIGNKNQIFDVNPLKQTISDLRNKNRRLKNLITHLQGALVSQQQRDLLYQDFELDLMEDVNSLEKRLEKLDELTKNVNKFAPPNKDVFAHPSPKILRESVEESFRTKATQEHQKLTQQALYNERKIVLMRMRLKLCHDRRDLVALRENLNMFEGGGKTMILDKELEETLKTQINNIKMKQQHERERIEHEKSPNIELHDAATAIQSLWRGYKTRMNFKEYNEKNQPHPEENEHHPEETEIKKLNLKE